MTEMPSHQPVGYECPFCRIAAGHDDGQLTRQADVVHRDETVTAFIASSWWPRNAGHVLVVPNGHFENVYDIPDDVLAAVQVVGKRMAVALKVSYVCDGTSFRQHNEPHGDQEVWHYHLHVFPRYENDGLYGSRKRHTSPEERLPYAEKLRAELSRQ